MKKGYVIAQNGLANTFFTASSSYDKPSWIPLKEATIYATAELADKALVKLLKHGAYSAKLVEATSMEFEFPNEGPNKDEAPITKTDNGMVAGQLSDEDDIHELNLDGDEIEMGDGYTDDEDEDQDDEGDFDNEGDSNSEEEFDTEEDERALSPLEQQLSQGVRGNMPTGNGPMKEAYDAYRATQGNVPLKKPKSSGGKGGRTVKLSDSEVREMRTMKKNGVKLSTIFAKWPNCAESTIKSILAGHTRNSVACDIEEGLNTTVNKIKFNQDNRNDRDTNFSKDIELSYKEINVPRNVMRAIKTSIDTFNKAADFNNGKDDSQASMALTIATALKTLEDCLKLGTHEGLTQAQIQFSTFMNPITTNIPDVVKDYLIKFGRQPISLKDTFYSKWDNIPKGD